MLIPTIYIVPIARNSAKLKGGHVVKYNDHNKAEGDCKLNRLLQVQPNPYMSAYDMLYKLVAHCYLYNNAFAYLQRENGQLIGVYPLHANTIDFSADSSGTLYCKFWFANGTDTPLPYPDIIHLRRNFNDNDLLGNDNTALSPALELAHTQNEGIVNGIKTGANIRGILHIDQLLADTKNSKGQFIFDNAKAMRPIEFIEQFCKHSKDEWAGQPVKLELFQKAFIAALFGFVDKETGLRKYRETLFMVGRKNGKSTLLASIALYMLMADNEPGAEIYSTATKKDQVKIIFDETHNMVQQSPEVRQLIKKRKTDLYFPASMAKFQALGKNSDTLDGLNASCVIMDELHSVKDRNLYEVMKQSQSSRRQPLLIMITTAGTLRECIFDDMYQYACSVVDGTFQDDTFLPIIYELDHRNEWAKPAAWQKANPGLGSIKKLDDLKVKVERAKNSPKDLNGILCKDFNIRETTSTAWLSFSDIDNKKTFEIERFRGSFFIGGADLSITTDLTCATALLMDKETEQRYAAQMYWLPEAHFSERVNSEKIPALALCLGGFTFI